MRLPFLLLLAISCFVSNAQNTSFYIQKENLNKDFDYLVNAIRETHPNPYSVIKKSEFENEVVKIKNNFKDSLSLKSYYQLIAPFVASMQDGHTSLAFPGRKLLQSGDNLFPYIIQASSKQPYLKVTENISEEYMEIPVGASILKINSNTASAIIQKIIDNTSGEDRVYRLKMGADYTMFAFVFGAYYELGQTTSVEYQFENQTFKKEIPTVTFANLMEIAKNRKQSNVKKAEAIQDFSLILKPEIATAILEIRFFSDKAKFDSFLEESFQAINDKKIKKLIIDIRENGGGNSALGDELLRYLSPKPFRQFDQTTIKYSQLQKDVYKSYCESDTLYCTTYDYINAKENGSVEVLPTKDLITPYLKSKQFDGKVCLLTSTRTFSSAMNLAQAFKHYKIGKIIGEETGGWIVSYGDKITTSLPISKLPLSISTKKFYTVGATDKDKHGVKPDIQTNKEEALDYALKNKI